MSASEEEVRKRVVDHVLKHGDDLEFTKCFWKGCEPLPRDIRFYGMFTEAVRRRNAGLDLDTVAGQVAVGFGSIDSWSKLQSMPKLAHYLKAMLRLGPPGPNRVWLNTDCTHGQALPVGQFVEVPTQVNVWDDIRKVSSQLIPLDEDGLPQGLDYVLGFFLGVMIGDASKKKQGRGHRHVALVLSKKYETNLKIGDYTASCAHMLGLRMHRQKDIEPFNGKPHGFFQWDSQASPLVDWFFHVALGLKEGERTTYEPVRADWVFDAPFEFRLGLIQGIAESDGSVSVASQEVEFWIGPNWDWMIKLLKTFHLNGFANREAVTLSKSQAIQSFAVPVFSDFLKTVRYGKLELMAKSKRLEKKERLPEEIRRRIAELAMSGMSIARIVESVATSYGILVSFEAAQRWAMKTGVYRPRSLVGTRPSL